jgi:hypothetical protein
VPATHFIDAMMQALSRRYYVSLVSAAELHGAVKPAESEPCQAMVDRHVTDRHLGTTELWFYKSRHAAYDIGIGIGIGIGIEQHDGPTGPLRVASRELTAVDLVRHANDCGGIATSQPSSTPSARFESRSSPRSPEPETSPPPADLATSSATSAPTSASAPSKNSPTSTATPPPTSPPADHDADASTPTGTCG